MVGLVGDKEEGAMKNKLRVGLILAVTALMSVAVPSRFNARAGRDDDTTTYRARLSGFGEVPPKLVDGQGSFKGTLSADKTSIA